MQGPVAQPANQDDRKALEAFVVDNEDLERLELLSAEFNIFEAIGAVRQELRHSELLAFLLDPSENHGLGDGFLRRFLQRAVAGAASQAPISPVDLDVWELDDVEVRREWSNIDILVVDARNRFVALIENKIDSGEHSDQLRRYWSAVEHEFAGYRMLGLFLTPGEDDPSDGRYLAIDYEMVADVAKRVVELRSSTIGPDVKTVLRHYEQMLRRHIVSDSEIAELCRRIYRKHRHAVDLILLHRPDAGQAAVRDLMERLIKDSADLVVDDSIKTYLRFAPQNWASPKLTQGTGWTKSGRTLLFEGVFNVDRVFIKLTLGPGPTEVRERIFRLAQSAPNVFKGNQKTLSPKWHQLFQRPILDATTLASEDGEAIEAVVREQWKLFSANELPAIRSAFEGEASLWEPLP
jgi:hypothetical protein